MPSLFFILTTLLALVAVHAAPAGQPSSVATTCSCSCPGVDTAGFPVGPGTTNDGTTLFCSYPAYDGESTSDFFCKYDSTSGNMMQDNDVGFCPNAAPKNCGTRRRNALPQVPAPPMAAPVARAPTPDEMKVRSQLKRQRVQADA